MLNWISKLIAGLKKPSWPSEEEYREISEEEYRRIKYEGFERASARIRKEWASGRLETGRALREICKLAALQKHELGDYVPSESEAPRTKTVRDQVADEIMDQEIAKRMVTMDQEIAEIARMKEAAG
jgi:hypothetical protein